MPERKGASYRIKATRPAHNHDEHTQTTQATAWARANEKVAPRSRTDSDYAREEGGV